MQFVKELTPSKYVAAEGWYVREHATEADAERTRQIASALKDKVLSSIVDDRVITIAPKQRVSTSEVEIQNAQIIPAVKVDTTFVTSAQAPTASTEVRGVWYTANLAYENGFYYPQLVVQINAQSNNVSALHRDLLESGVQQLTQAGFYGNGWTLFTASNHARLRAQHGTDNARQAFIALGEIVEAAKARCNLPFGRVVEIF